MTHLNRAVAGLARGGPIFYTGGHTGAELTFEAGRNAAATWADYINVGMEHGTFDLAGLDRFMRGLAAAHRESRAGPMPAVIVELPVEGASAEILRANAWQVRQLLARGVHGLMLCHAECPDAVSALVEAVRFSFRGGRRGAGGHVSAAEVWGVSPAEYLELADPWPLNPDGELLIGLKIENRRALERAEETTRVPGVAFAEWGPADMSMSFGYRGAPEDFARPELAAARERVFRACRSAGIAFLEGATRDTVEAKIAEGVRVFNAADEETAMRGRAVVR
ncbi:MAG: aldolase/citrate lyase family protein [Gammaproteobacteria bacterium]|nr:aldolase/citrate lyase family protein [Gammaproteobacteria bacterium]